MTTMDWANCVSTGPQSALERKIIEEYLQRYRSKDLQELPKEEAKRLT